MGSSLGLLWAELWQTVPAGRSPPTHQNGDDQAQHSRWVCHEQRIHVLIGHSDTIHVVTLVSAASIAGASSFLPVGPTWAFG